MIRTTVRLTIPSSAAAGSSVPWSARVTETYDVLTISGTVRLFVNGIQVGSSIPITLLGLGFTDVSGTFTMPSFASTIDVYVDIDAHDGNGLQPDSTDEKNILVTGATTYTLTFGWTDNGFAYVNGITYNNNSVITFGDGQSVELNAIPAENYTFDGWYEGTNRISTDLSYSYVVHSNRSITAKFGTATAISVVPSIVISGNNATVYIDGLRHFAGITVSIPKTGGTWNKVTGSHGELVLPIDISKDLPGIYQVQASDGTSTVTANYEIIYDVTKKNYANLVISNVTKV